MCVEFCLDLLEGMAGLVESYLERTFSAPQYQLFEILFKETFATVDYKYLHWEAEHSTIEFNRPHHRQTLWQIYLFGSGYPGFI